MTYLMNETTENTIAHLKSIFEKDRRKPIGESNFQEISKDDEYQQIIFELWDYCDTLPLSTIESTIVELEGHIIGLFDELKKLEKPISEIIDTCTFDETMEKYEEIKKALSDDRRTKTNLEQYLSCRIEQGEYEQ